MENSLNFTETDNKIRKKWLFWVVKLPVFVVVSFIIVGILDVLIAPDFTKIKAIVLISLFAAGGSYLNYYCAYKNPGTILLLLMMIGIPINILTIFLDPSDLALMKVSTIFLLVVLMRCIYEFTMFYYSYKLREINKKMQKRRLTSSPVYINAFSVFSTATHL